jgi:hypothetical protein
MNDQRLTGQFDPADDEVDRAIRAALNQAAPDGARERTIDAAAAWAQLGLPRRRQRVLRNVLALGFLGELTHTVLPPPRTNSRSQTTWIVTSVAALLIAIVAAGVAFVALWNRPMQPGGGVELGKQKAVYPKIDTADRNLSEHDLGEVEAQR